MRRVRISRVWRKEGQSLVIVALMLPVLLGVAGAGVTVGTVYYAQSRLQNAVDAAALAAAKTMETTNNAAEAENQSALVSQDDSAARDATVTVSSSPTDSVLATASAQSSTAGGFAAVFGHSRFGIQAQAKAAVSPGGPFNFAVFQGDPNPSQPPLTFNGTDQVLSPTPGNTANVHSNNDVLLNGNVTVQGSCGGDPSVSVGGNSSCAAGTIAPAPQVAMPVWSANQVTPPNATTIGSASNPTGLTVNGSASLSGNDVIYGNLVFSGDDTVTGHFLVYGNIVVNGNCVITGSLTSIGGSVTLNGNVAVNGSGGLAVVALTANGSTSNSTSGPGSITVNGGVSINSTLYAPNGGIVLNGNDTVNGSIVGYAVTMNGTVNVTPNAADNAALPVQQVMLLP